ncbi:mycothiol synthase [Cellulomonas biazotea]|uniref:Mycothiol acetyltransferase n=1 Tax=Cellulomonas biazotea TaxID=1709 RepID=A0A402DMA5_9CELL|nr:mycothiol synthase [Cellulomonas biazotea]GCE75250.1 mycothiol acetyltransferase [Cellulomonas biazotea]
MSHDTNAQVTIGTTTTRPDAATAAQVSALAGRAHQVDGVAPLSEQPLLRLTTDHAPVVHLTARTADGDLVGYAQVDVADASSAAAELVVDPAHRRRGAGRALLHAALALAHAEPGRDLRVWAHGDLPVARAFAAAVGFGVVRELWKMRLDLAARTPSSRPLPPGTTVRTFVPGQDEQAWQRVNARAFAQHPEQGRMTVDDVRDREREPWFDPEGFLLAERDGDLVAFLWTKVHAAGEEADEPVGELYAVGVDPDAQGLGLGSALTTLALDHLAAAGLSTVVLYVEADNAAAVRTYAAQGFVRASADVMLGSDTGRSPSGATMAS